jgi:signal transduction histidine kinase/CheY-like chemotaxis protein/ligand-binding sensor domain-containing protein
MGPLLFCAQTAFRCADAPVRGLGFVLALLVAAEAYGQGDAIFAPRTPLRLSQYARRTWTGLDNLPEDSVLSMALSADGAVMVSTEVGPFRFDGVHFTAMPWQREAWGRVASSMLTVGDDVLVGSESALVRMRPHKTDVVPVPEDCAGAIQLAMANDGAPWLICFRGGVMRAGPNGLEAVPTPGVARGLYQADDGLMYVASDEGVVAFRNGAATRTWTEADGLPGRAAHHLTRRRQGGLWVGTSRGLGYIDEHGVAHSTALENQPIGDVIERADGSVWGALLPGGLFRLEGNVVEIETSSQVPAWANISDLLEDREGSLWVSSSTNGLTCLHVGPVTPMGVEEGLRSAFSWSVDVAGDNSTWLATDSNGVWHDQRGVMTHYGAESGLGNLRLLAAHVDKTGVLWVGAQEGRLYRFNGTRFEERRRDLEHPEAAVSAITFNPVTNAMFIGTDSGVLREDHGAFVPLRAPFRVEVTDLTWGRDGTLWVSSSRGLWRVEDNALVRVVPSLRSSLSALIERPDGTFWAATNDRGIASIDPKTDQLRTCGEDQGMPHNNTWSLVRDPLAQYWVSSNHGIWSIREAELEACLAHGTPLPEVRVFGAGDGMRDRECCGGYQSPAVVAPDGRIIFACVQGAMTVWPQHQSNQVKPALRIDRVDIDGVPLVSTAPVVSGGRGRMAFAFSVYSYRDPTAVRAKYQLEGFETRWTEATLDRTAQYTNLPPGHYRFHVIAANEDGVWNQEGTSLEVEIPPRLWERWWFRVLLVVAVVALAGSWVRVRDERLKTREAEVARLVTQRTAELERAKLEAEQTNRAKTDFLANMSHEIRTPLNAVIGASELFDLTTLTVDQREYLGLIRSSGDALLSLINDVLDLSKIESGKMQLSTTPCDVRVVGARVTDLLNLTARKKNLLLSFDCTPEVPQWALIDEARLRQVLLNLIGNAIKFTDQGAVVVVVNAEGPNRLRFSVIDSGIGLSQEQLGRLFKAFSQADTSTSRRYGGTGLGLAISDRLVTMMGGRFDVTSTPGQGSRFSFEIHAMPCGPPPLAEPVTQLLPRLKVLLVDDNVINLRVSCDLLVRLGMDVVRAQSGEEAIAMALATPFDLVLMDLQMPGMDGLAATKLLFEQVTKPPVVVALTANALEEDRQACLHVGMRDYLTKPVRKDAFATLIRKLFVKPEQV